MKLEQGEIDSSYFMYLVTWMLNINAVLFNSFSTKYKFSYTRALHSNLSSIDLNKLNYSLVSACNISSTYVVYMPNSIFEIFTKKNAGSGISGIIQNFEMR